MKVEDLKFGCDPETFLFDKGVGEYVSAHGLFPGTKEEPFKLDKGAVQVDGMALEFNIEPAKTAEEFNNNIEVVLVQIREMVHKVNPDFELMFTPVARFNPQYFEYVSPEAKILGCEPDFDPTTGRPQAPNEDLANRPVRTAAGHVHIGWINPEEKKIDPFEKGHLVDCQFIARYFLSKKFFVPKTKEEQDRLMYYGAHNPFRPKPYGVELRGPSNLWVQHKNSRMNMYNILVNNMKLIIQNANTRS